jgi:ArsR family metal-binding transcriptional regulator
LRPRKEVDPVGDQGHRLAGGERNMPFVSCYHVVKVLPCLADSSKIRVVAELDSDVGEVLPYLSAALKDVVFNPDEKTLIFKKGDIRFTFRRNAITATKLRDVEAAYEELGRVVNSINDVWERRAAITPRFERGVRLTALQLCKGFPATNCRDCSEPSCLSFAEKLLSGKTSVLACKPLFTPKFRWKRLALLHLLEGAGYEVPAEFLA